MNQDYNTQTFEYAKSKISESADKLYRYIILATIIGIALVVILAITLFIVLIPLGFSIEDFNPNNIYETGEAIIASGILSSGIVAFVFLGIALVALIVILFMSYVQYYRLGTAFSKLYQADRTLETTKFISYGFYGYIIAIIAGMFIPGVGGNVVSIAGNVSLAVAAFLIYQLFGEYKSTGRFRGKPSMYLFIGLAVNVVSSISSMFSTYGPIGSLVGFILMLLGFRDLSRDIRMVEPQSHQKMRAQAVPVEGYSESKPTAAQVEPAQDKTNFCSKCGAKAMDNGKFCQSCGASL